MIYGFDDNKVKKSVVPCGGVKEATIPVYTKVVGENSITRTASADGLMSCILNTTEEDDVVRDGSGVTTGAYINIMVNNVSYGNFYIGPGETTYFYSPVVPIKAGDVITVTNGYSDTTVHLSVKFLYFEEV